MALRVIFTQFPTLDMLVRYERQQIKSDAASSKLPRLGLPWTTPSQQAAVIPPRDPVYFL